MCGIVAYTGSKSCQQLVLEGLKRLEYRGYDSAGIATIEGGRIKVVKTVGRVANLEDSSRRWAAFGARWGWGTRAGRRTAA